MFTILAVEQRFRSRRTAHHFASLCKIVYIDVIVKGTYIITRLSKTHDLYLTGRCLLQKEGCPPYYL